MSSWFFCLRPLLAFLVAFLVIVSIFSLTRITFRFLFSRCFFFFVFGNQAFPFSQVVILEQAETAVYSTVLRLIFFRGSFFFSVLFFSRVVRGIDITRPCCA